MTVAATRTFGILHKIKTASHHRQKNYSSFETVHDESVEMKENKKGASGYYGQWVTEWMQGEPYSKQKAQTKQARKPTNDNDNDNHKAKSKNKKKQKQKQNNEEKRLRQENETLKNRLNAANTQIRDLENVYKNRQNQQQNQQQQNQQSSTPMRCNPFARKQREKDTAASDRTSFYSDTAQSEASTVQMGSSAFHKSHHARKNSATSATPNDSHESNSNSNITNNTSAAASRFGTRFKKKLSRSALAELQTSSPEQQDVTPPCTPERSRSISSDGATPMPIEDILKDIETSETSSTLGIVNFDQTPVPKGEKQRNLQLFTRLALKPKSKNKSGQKQYLPYGFPIDLQKANNISEEVSFYSSDDEDPHSPHLPVIFEERSNSTGDRVEI